VSSAGDSRSRLPLKNPALGFWVANRRKPGALGSRLTGCAALLGSCSVMYCREGQEQDAHTQITQV
jgi:hypothetical protein